jgi:hypothetical protein
MIVTISNFKDQLLSLETVLKKPSITGMRVNIFKSKFLAEQNRIPGMFEYQKRYTTYIQQGWDEW